MSYAGIIQGTEEWFAIKRGKISGSHMADVMAGGKGLTRQAYLMRVVLERMTGITQETYCSFDMQKGIDLEPKAREVYELMQGVEVEQIAFIDHPTIESFGVSPDGLIGLDGMQEIKCLNDANHAAFLLDRKIPGGRMKQMQSQLTCAKRKWNDYTSYNPNFPIKLQLATRRVERDENMIKDIEGAVILFEKDVVETIKKLEALTQP